ncbi:MAG: hypothetical protein M3Z64_04380, partial [Verrucomicrobiota bacterium]|nr:hypothetical protein [Verrucomicrobiota bacterium]
GTLASSRNLISGTSVGVLSGGTPGSSGISIQGNIIGLKASGLAAIPSPDVAANFDVGLYLPNGTNITIGGSPAGRNVVSGHATRGIQLAGSSNTLSGNFIGTDVTGTAPIPNGDGVLVVGTNQVIGGAGVGAGNVISGNMGVGLLLGSPDGLAFAHSAVVTGNLIGTSLFGARLGNGSYGIEISGVRI